MENPLMGSLDDILLSVDEDLDGLLYNLQVLLDFLRFGGPNVLQDMSDFHVMTDFFKSRSVIKCRFAALFQQRR